MESGATIGTKKKVVLAFLLGVGSITIALIISYLGFNKMLIVVDELAAPNQKLKTLHNLYQRVTELDHRQRLEAIQKPGKPDQDFLRESNSLLTIVDTLIRMPWSDSLQFQRLRDIQNILHHRDSLFIKYLQMKSNSSRNRKLSRKFDTLANILSRNTVITDTSVRTTQKKKTTVNYSKDSIVPPPVQKRSFLSRLFKKKLPPVVESLPKERVTEEVMITIDTVAMSQRNNSIMEATKLIKELGTNELSRRKRLASRELALLQTTNGLFSQMTEIVHQVEGEEISLVRKNNEAAIFLFHDSIRNMVLILIVFALLAAVLVYLILIDITRSNFYRVRLIEAKDKAEELSHVKQRFLDNMSHEIRTPLQSIIGFAEQLLKKDLPANSNEVRAIYNSSEHLLHVVNEVLDLSRLESGKFNFENVKFYLLEVVEEVAMAMQVQAAGKGLQFHFDADGCENACLSGDPFRLKQILYNVLGNAIKFTSEGLVRLDMWSHPEGKNLNVGIRISDTGIGIHKTEIDRIFQRFEQANATIGNLYGGSGLGLTIVRKLVQAQNGTITVTSSPGKGSTFEIELMFEQVTENVEATSKHFAGQTNSGHVLVIDDDPSILVLCGVILNGSGYRWTTENYPETLFDGLIDDGVTHVLMDVRMGKVSGLDLGRVLRSKVNPGVPIIAMSALAQINNEPRFHEVFDGLLLKPFRASELKSILDQFPGKALKSWEAGLRRLTLGDVGLLRSALNNFIKETENDIFLLENALEKDRPADIKEILHKMRGRVGQFGYLSVAASLNDLEKLMEGDHSARRLNEEISRLKPSIIRIISKTKEELVTLK